MQKAIALIVIVAISSSLQQPVESEVQSEVQTEEQTEDGTLATPVNYVIPFFKANWFKAVEYCNYHGLRLAIVNSKAKETQLYDAIRASDIYANHSNLVWVGANDLADEGNFHWHGTGKRVNYTRWADSQPDNYRQNEHCVEVGQNEQPGLIMKWNDRNCKDNLYFVCEEY